MSFFAPKLTNRSLVSAKKRGVLFYNPSRWRSFVFGIGSGLVVTATLMFLYFYFPLLSAVINYYWTPSQNETSFQPPARPTPTPGQTAEPKTVIDLTDFYIFIPKIKAQAKVIPNVSVASEIEYLNVLKKGVAHAAGSAFPGEGKTIYLFAHSTNSPFNVVRYNAVFFLLDQMEKNDAAFIFFNGQRYQYQVEEKHIIDPQQTDYLYYSDNREVLILQTCWPPGTTWKRLLVILSRVE